MADQIVRVVSRTADGEALRWVNEVQEGQILPLAAPDLGEALGPLVENAARHALAMVRLMTRGAGLAVEDDGPGLGEDQRRAALLRGVRFDERGGAGLGLSIAGEVLEAYGWRLELGESDLGGLRTELQPKP